MRVKKTGDVSGSFRPSFVFVRTLLAISLQASGSSGFQDEKCQSCHIHAMHTATWLWTYARPSIPSTGDDRMAVANPSIHHRTFDMSLWVGRAMITLQSPDPFPCSIRFDSRRPVHSCSVTMCQEIYPQMHVHMRAGQVCVRDSRRKGRCGACTRGKPRRREGGYPVFQLSQEGACTACVGRYSAWDDQISGIQVLSEEGRTIMRSEAKGWLPGHVGP